MSRPNIHRLGTPLYQIASTGDVPHFAGYDAPARMTSALPHINDARVAQLRVLIPSAVIARFVRSVQMLLL